MIAINYINNLNPEKSEYTMKLSLISKDVLEGTARTESGDIIAEADIKFTRR